MEYQMRHFRQVFGEVMEFVIVDAPFRSQEKPEKALLRFLPECGYFVSWLKFHSWKNDDNHTSGPNVVYGLEEMVEYLIDILRIQGPFDGVLCFSQGGIAFRHFHRITQ